MNGLAVLNVQAVEAAAEVAAIPTRASDAEAKAIGLATARNHPQADPEVVVVMVVVVDDPHLIAVDPDRLLDVEVVADLLRLVDLLIVVDLDRHPDIVITARDDARDRALGIAALLLVIVVDRTRDRPIERDRVAIPAIAVLLVAIHAIVALNEIAALLLAMPLLSPTVTHNPLHPPPNLRTHPRPIPVPLLLLLLPSPHLLLPKVPIKSHPFFFFPNTSQSLTDRKSVV